MRVGRRFGRPWGEGSGFEPAGLTPRDFQAADIGVANLTATGQLGPTSPAPCSVPMALPSVHIATVTEPNDPDDPAVIERLEDNA